MAKKTSVFTATRPWATLVAITAVLACRASDAIAVSLTSNTNQTLTVPAGRQFTITLGTVGPGDFSAPPAISTAAVRYVTVKDVEPFVPAGPRQRFLFDAAAPGTAVITFTHTGMTPNVQDTVIVR